MTLERKCISVVVPIYNEQDTLPELWKRLQASLATLSFENREILLVSDGSTDGSEDIIADLVHHHAEAKGVFLTRNFGHQAAVSIGLAESTGSVVTVMDGDLQDPPEVLPQLVAALEAGADVAYGIRKNRKETVLRRAAYHVFYRLLHFVAECQMPLDSGDFCCMRREVVEAIVRLPERNRFVRGLRAWVGYRQVGVEYEREERFAGRPKYTLRSLLGLAYDGLFSFSKLPARVIQFTGFLVALISLMVALAYVVWYFFDPKSFPRGFATLVVSIWFLGGVQLFSLGILGEYVTRTCDESRRRPVALVRQVLVSPKCRP